MLSLGSGVIRNYRNTKFSPSVFFAAQTGGAWYNLQDMSTLYQDTAKTTPVTATGQTIALVADKSGFGNDVQVSGTYELIEPGLYGIQHASWSSLKTLLDTTVGSTGLTSLNYTEGFSTSQVSGYLLASVYVPNTLGTPEMELIKTFFHNTIWEKTFYFLPGQMTPGLCYPTPNYIRQGEFAFYTNPAEGMFNDITDVYTLSQTL